MRRPLAFLLSGVFAFAVFAAGPLTSAPPVSAATIAATTACANGVDNTGGLGLICQVTIVNTITASGGSAVVTVRECHGAAGDPEAACTTETTSLTEPVTAVTQCNDSINGGGGTLRCSVVVRNDFIDLRLGATAATVNQCVGSAEDTIGCDPYPASTTDATITQCNGSANGGTLVGLTCTATGTKSSVLSVTINQCNGSANGGGALVICSASLTNNIISLATPTPAPVVAPVNLTPVVSPAPTETPAPTIAPVSVTPTETPAPTVAPVNVTPVVAPAPPAAPVKDTAVDSRVPALPETSTNQLTDRPSGMVPFVLAGLFFLFAIWAVKIFRREPA